MKKIPMWLYYFLIVFPWLGIFISILTDIYNNSPEYQTLNEMLYIEPSNWELWCLGLIALIALVNTIGLLLKQHWARKLYIFSMVIYPLTYLINLDQWVYMSQLGAMFYDLSNVAVGMLFIILLVPHLYEPIFSSKYKEAQKI